MPRTLNSRATLSIQQLLSPHDEAIPGKSTWWLCLAKEELEARLEVLRKEPLADRHPILRDRLEDRYQLVWELLQKRLHRGEAELPDLSKMRRGTYGYVRIG